MNFHSQDLPLSNSSPNEQSHNETLEYQQQKPKGFSNLGDFMNGPNKNMMHKNEGGLGGRYVVSKSMSSSTSIVNGKKTVKTVEKMQYSDGTMEEI